jgi:hypothetical protein
MNGFLPFHEVGDWVAVKRVGSIGLVPNREVSVFVDQVK